MHVYDCEFQKSFSSQYTMLGELLSSTTPPPLPPTALFPKPERNYKDCSTMSNALVQDTVNVNIFVLYIFCTIRVSEISVKILYCENIFHYAIYRQ